MDNLQQIISQLSELSKLLNNMDRGSLKLEVHGATWYFVKNIEQFEKEIFQRHTKRIQNEMFEVLHNFKGTLPCPEVEMKFFSGVEHETIPPQMPVMPHNEPKHIKLPSPSHIQKLGGNKAIKDFTKRHNLFHDKTRDVFVKKV